MSKLKKVLSWFSVLIIVSLVLVGIYAAGSLSGMTDGSVEPLVPPTAIPAPTAIPTCTLHVSYVSGEEVLWNSDFPLIPVRYSEEQYFWGASETVYNDYMQYLKREPHMVALADNLKKFGYSDVITAPYVDFIFYDDSNGHVAHAEEGLSGYKSESQMQCPSDGFTLKANIRYSLVEGWELSGKAVSGGDSVWLSDGASSIQLTLPPNPSLLADPTISYNPDSPDIKIWDEKDLLLMQRPTGSFKIVWGSPMATRIYRIARDLPAMVFYQTVSDGSVQGVFQQLLLDK